LSAEFTGGFGSRFGRVAEQVLELSERLHRINATSTSMQSADGSSTRIS